MWGIEGEDSKFAVKRCDDDDDVGIDTEPVLALVGNVWEFVEVDAGIDVKSELELMGDVWGAVKSETLLVPALSPEIGLTEFPDVD